MYVKGNYLRYLRKRLKSSVPFGRIFIFCRRHLRDTVLFSLAVWGLTVIDKEKQEVDVITVGFSFQWVWFKVEIWIFPKKGSGWWVVERQKEKLWMTRKPKHLSKCPETQKRSPFAWFKCALLFLQSGGWIAWQLRFPFSPMSLYDPITLKNGREKGKKRKSLCPN